MRKLILALSVALLPSIDIGLAGSALAAPPADSPSTSGAAIVQTALRYLGYPYTTVGNSPSAGFSCIGFVSYVYQSNGIPLPDDLGGAMGYAPAVSFSDLQPGDVLYFQNTVWSGLSHTAIYLGGGRFVHAEWYNRGVVISSFTDDPVDGNYWSDHYLGANRPWTLAASAVSAAAAAAPAAPTPAVPAPAKPRPRLLDGPRVRVQVAGLNVRLRPSLFAPILRLAAMGTTVVVLKQYRTWDWVQFPDGSFGWVAGAAIGTGNAAPVANSLSAEPLPLTTPTIDGLRVHVRPNLAAPVVASAFHGQKVLVLKRWLGWLRILLPDGTRGWVDGALIASAAAQQDETAHAGSEPAPTSTHPTGPTITATVRVHARPGLQAPVLRLAVAGTHVQVLGSRGQWVRALLPDGESGWISSAYVHLLCPLCGRTTR